MEAEIGTEVVIIEVENVRGGCGGPPDLELDLEGSKEKRWNEVGANMLVRGIGLWFKIVVL